MIRIAASAAFAGLALLAGCSSTGSDQPSAQAVESTTPGAESATSSADPTLDDRCEGVSAAMMKGIMAGAQDGTGMKGVQAVAVKSEDYAKVWMIAIEFSATGIDNQIGVWASNALQPGGGIIMSVDGFA